MFRLFCHTFLAKQNPQISKFILMQKGLYINYVIIFGGPERPPLPPSVLSLHNLPALPNPFYVRFTSWYILAHPVTPVPKF